MKKKSLDSLCLNKSSISELEKSNLNGGRLWEYWNENGGGEHSIFAGRSYVCYDQYGDKHIASCALAINRDNQEFVKFDKAIFQAEDFKFEALDLKIDFNEIQF